METSLSLKLPHPHPLPSGEGITPMTSFWRGKRVFITGHSGFKGSWLTLWLESMGAKIGGYSLLPDYTPNLYSLLTIASRCEKNHIADIRDLSSLSAAIGAFAPQLVIHLAAQPLVRRSYREPLDTISINALGTANLLEACRKVETLQAILVVTSDKCYRNASTAHREDDALGGSDIYSASKACADILTHAYRDSFFDIPVTTVRSGNVIGGGDWSEDRLIPDAVRAFSQDLPLTIRSPHSLRPWQHVAEATLGYLMLARAMLQKNPVSSAYNFGPDRAFSVEHVIRQCASLWQPAGQWRTEPSAIAEAPTLLLDASLAQRELGWKPQLSFEETIRYTIDWYRDYYAKKPPAELYHAMISLCARLGSVD